MNEVRSHTRVFKPPKPKVHRSPSRFEPPSVVITADESEPPINDDNLKVPNDVILGSPRRASLARENFSQMLTQVADKTPEYGSFKKVNGYVGGLGSNHGSESGPSRNSSTSLRESVKGDAMLGSDSRVASGCGQQRSYISVQSSDKFSGCCTEHRKKMSYGFFLTALITMSWAGGTHFLKAIEDEYQHALVANAHAAYLVFNSSSQHTNGPTSIKQPPSVRVPLYHAPFFTTWFCTTFNALFYPVYITSRLCVPASEKPSLKKELVHTVQPYQEKGVSVGHFLCHCGTFTVLWVLSHYLFIRSLALLDATDVIALYATSVVFFYLLSWVLLQEQFVGIRIVAVIICNTGIALFAYMDGQSRSATLGGVVMAATASAGTAVQKVVFKKFIGEVNFAQMSLFISFVGIFDLILMWPLFLILYFTGLEVIEWENLPWLPLICASVFIFFANLLGNFGLMWTYETFLTLGLCIAIPVSAVVDSYLYSVTFRGMKLAGMILTIWGFLTVLLPNNWPDYLTVLLRSGRRKFTSERPNSSRSSTASRLRTHSGRVR